MKCEDHLGPEGIETTVYGSVFDSVNNIPVAGYKMLIMETNHEVSGIGPKERFIQYLDSTYTDAEGFYELTFTTSGSGDTYRIQPEIKEDIWTFFQDPVEIDAGKKTVMDFNFLHLYPAVLNLAVDRDVEHLPVMIDDAFSYFSVITIEETDTVIQKRIFIDKNSTQRIRILRKVALNQYEDFYYVIPITNTTEETVYDIKIGNSDFTNNN